MSARIYGLLKTTAKPTTTLRAVYSMLVVM